jgi:hypothetical protein
MYQNSACPSTLVGYAANVDKGRRVFQGQWKVVTDQKPEMIMVQKRNAHKEASLHTEFVDDDNPVFGCSNLPK